MYEYLCGCGWEMITFRRKGELEEVCSANHRSNHNRACPPRSLSGHHQTHKLLVVDVALRVLLVDQQLLDLIVGQLLAQSGQQMTQLGGGNVAAGVLVEVAQTLDEIVRCVTVARLRDRLVDGQKHFERDAIVGLQLLRALLHVRLGGILAEGAQTFADLR